MLAVTEDEDDATLRDLYVIKLINPKYYLPERFSGVNFNDDDALL